MHVQVCTPDISGSVGEARDSLATRSVTIAHFLRVFPLLRVAVDQVLLRDRAAIDPLARAQSSTWFLWPTLARRYPPLSGAIFTLSCY